MELTTIQKRELWKGAKVIFWGLIGIAFVAVLQWLGADMEPIQTALVSLATNAIAFTAWRFFSKKD